MGAPQPELARTAEKEPALRVDAAECTDWRDEGRDISRRPLDHVELRRLRNPFAERLRRQRSCPVAHIASHVLAAPAEPLRLQVETHDHMRVGGRYINCTLVHAAGRRRGPSSGLLRQTRIDLIYLSI